MVISVSQMKGQNVTVTVTQGSNHSIPIIFVIIFLLEKDVILPIMGLM